MILNSHINEFNKSMVELTKFIEYSSEKYFDYEYLLQVFINVIILEIDEFSLTYFRSNVFSLFLRYSKEF
jgi:hypothetical protein